MSVDSGRVVESRVSAPGHSATARKSWFFPKLVKALQLLAVICFWQAVAASQAGTEHRAFQATASDLFKAVSPSVVTLKTPLGTGSGVLIDPTGVLVTNLHVLHEDGIPPVASLTVLVQLSSGEQYSDVTVVDFDRIRDLIVLKVDGPRFRVALLGDSDSIKVGDDVYAIGSPLGLGQTFSQGIVSQRRDVNGFQEIQTTAAISPGSSGGGLFDRQGRLIGVTNLLFEGGQNLGFAVPSNYIRSLLQSTTTFPLSELHARVAARAPRETPLARNRADIPHMTYATYANPTNEDRAVVEQHGPRLRLAFTSKSGSIYGHAELSWNPSLEGFDGAATLIRTCGVVTVRRIEVPVKFYQLFVVSESLIRTRWLNPDQLDCDKREVLTYSWEEALWSVPPR